MSDLDLALAEKVELALRRSPLASKRTMRADSRGGQVTLSGRVPTFYQKQLAQEIVRRIDGVDQVENQLEVSWA